MCGIAGFVGFRNDKLIKQFSEWLKHRGPDGDGYYLGSEVSLLNRRLAIIDVKGGDQPIYNEDKTVVVVYNGEIYNYQELRSELEKDGHVFRTKSDTEVIVHGYEEWGEDCFDRFNGMFAVALYDEKKKKLLLVRDHFGIKPLYFSRLDSALVFSSEIKPLIYSGLFPVAPHDKTIYRYLKYRIHDEGRETFFKNIERLLPGEIMIVTDGKTTIRKFTGLEQDLLENVNRSDTKALGNEDINRFKELLIDSVQKRLISEVPVGTCLSGGLDSSTVVAIVNKLLQEKTGESKSVGDIQKTFSAVFPGSSNDEERYINELLATSKDIKDYKIYPKTEGFFEDLGDFIKTQEEPTISTGPYAQYKVMQKAHEFVTVVLDGQGADEMMAGYLPYYFVYLRQLYKQKKYTRLLKELLLSKDVVLKYVFKPKGKRSGIKNWLNEEFAHTYKDEKFVVENTNLKKRLIQDIFSNSLQSLLRYEDKNAMRFSIEGRVPFLDFRLVRQVFSLPEEAIIRDGWNKYILRRSTEDLLPKLINRRRNKIGFTTPEYEWFKRESKKVMDFFTGERFEAKKYINQAEVAMLFQDFISGKNDDTMFFWRILNLELWLREFINSGKSSVASSSAKKDIEREIKLQGKSYLRYPIKTHVFKKGDDIPAKVTHEVSGSMSQSAKMPKHKKWIVVVSEKIVATAQGRAYFIWDIKPSFWASFLSRFVSKVPWGIGLGSPWTMQLAIQEVGLPRIIFASALGAFGKMLGIKGLFYRIAGRQAAGIDGPTEYSVYPANVSAKLLPKDPEKVCLKIHEKLTQIPDLESNNFLGAAIIDANDIGQNVLGNSTGLPNQLIEQIFKDNPMGQTNEQTPVTIVFCD